MRRYGEPPRRNQRYHYRPGVYAILLRGQEVLVTHQAEPVPEFQLPGGGVDPGESLTWRTNVSFTCRNTTNGQKRSVTYSLPALLCALVRQQKQGIQRYGWTWIQHLLS